MDKKMIQEQLTYAMVEDTLKAQTYVSDKSGWKTDQLIENLNYIFDNMFNFEIMVVENEQGIEAHYNDPITDNTKKVKHEWTK